MHFVIFLEIDAFEGLASLAVSFVPTTRLPYQSELRHLQTFLGLFNDCDPLIKQVLLKHLARRSQQLKATPELHSLINALAEEDRAPFFAEIYRLSLAFTGNRERNKEFIHTVGSLLGLNGKMLKEIENQVEAENVPRLLPDGQA